MGVIKKRVQLEGDHAEKAELTSDPKSPLPSGIKVTRGHPRARNVQVRFSHEEFDRVTNYAASQDLPVSTVIRLIVLKAIEPSDELTSRLARMETDIAQIKRTILKG